MRMIADPAYLRRCSHFIRATSKACRAAGRARLLGFAGLLALAAGVPIARGDDCGGLHRNRPDLYAGAVRPDPDNPQQPDAKWLSRLPIGAGNIIKYAGGPLWDGDSVANDDANDLLTTAPGATKPEYASLRWDHPVNLAVSGDNVANVLYRLYALEQGLALTAENAPPTLVRTSQNALARVKAPFMVVHIGTNLIYKNVTADEIATSIEALACELNHDLPHVGKIVIVSIYPRGPFFNMDLAKRVQINGALATAAATHAYPFVFIDATAILENICRNNFDSKGLCIYYKDLTHPSAAASYKVDKLIAKTLKTTP